MVPVAELRRVRARGQALLLFSLTLLLLTLMVLITLTISSQVKERIEAQAVADAAAYSEAVVTARAFNSISVLNRAQVSHMVALAAVQSLISWSGVAKASLIAARDALNSMASDCTCDSDGVCTGANCGCDDSDLAQANAAIANYERTAVSNARWEAADNAAGDQQLALQGIAGAYLGYGRGILAAMRTKAEGRGGTESIAERLARDARAGSPWRSEPRELFASKAVMSGSGYPTQKELAGAVYGYAYGGGRGTNVHSVAAAHGTRLDGFVTTRAGGGGALSNMLNRLIAPAGFTASVSNTGAGYFSTARHGGPSGAQGWADDEGNVSITRAQGSPCKTSGSRGVYGWLKGTCIDTTNDQHVWSPRGDTDDVPPLERHTYGGHTDPQNHGMWVQFVDYNEGSVSDARNIFGQPKNVVVIQRDLSVRDSRPDPWAFKFRFQFSPSLSGTNFDITSQSASQRVQAAVATGLVYYHRGGGSMSANWDHWKEPPNFFNPFWRATLVATDVDEAGRQRGAAAEEALQDHGLYQQADTVRLLRRNGFRGFQ